MYLILQTTVSPGHASLIPQKVRTVLPISHMVDALTPLYHAADMHYRRQRLRLWRSERRSGNSVDEQTSPSNNQALSSNPTPTSPPRDGPPIERYDAAYPTRPFCRCNRIGELSLSFFLPAASLTLWKLNMSRHPISRCTVAPCACLSNTALMFKLAAPSAEMPLYRSLQLGCSSNSVNSSIFPTLRGRFTLGRTEPNPLPGCPVLVYLYRIARERHEC
jgi:hypothetical protein